MTLSSNYWIPNLVSSCLTAFPRSVQEHMQDIGPGASCGGNIHMFVDVPFGVVPSSTGNHVVHVFAALAAVAAIWVTMWNDSFGPARQHGSHLHCSRHWFLEPMSRTMKMRTMLMFGFRLSLKRSFRSLGPWSGSLSPTSINVSATSTPQGGHSHLQVPRFHIATCTPHHSGERFLMRLAFSVHLLLLLPLPQRLTLVSTKIITIIILYHFGIWGPLFTFADSKWVGVRSIWFSFHVFHIVSLASLASFKVSHPGFQQTTVTGTGTKMRHPKMQGTWPVFYSKDFFFAKRLLLNCYLVIQTRYRRHLLLAGFAPKFLSLPCVGFPLFLPGKAAFPPEEWWSWRISRTWSDRFQ